MYKTNKEVRGSLLIGMVQAMVAKLSGHPNPEHAAIVMNFFIGLDAKSRKACDYAASNLVGPRLRAVQRTNGKNRDDNIILSDFANVMKRLNDILDKVHSDTGRDQSFSLSFDGTKTPAKLQVSTAHKAVVGGVDPEHVIDISEANSGVVGSEQKCKSLQGRWMEKNDDENTSNDAVEENLNMGLRRGRLIKIKVGKKDDKQECCFRTLGLYTKTYNKWYPDDNCQPWIKNGKQGKYRVLARMVKRDPCFGWYNDVNPQNSHWAPECVYVLCDGKDITAMWGTMESDN